MEAREMAALMGALAQETRLDVLRLLLAEGASGLPAGEVAARLGVVRNTLSFHLAAMERAGLLVATRRGRSILYAVRVARVREFVVFLTETCCRGDPSRCGDLGRLVEDLWENPSVAQAAPAHTVLFLCTRNSARSIMAEAILAKLGEGRFRALSAGPDPSPTGPMPEVLAKLAAMGHDVSGLRSKDWSEVQGSDPDLVITLCDTLEGQECPEFGGRPVTAAWPLPDPAKFAGNDAERQTLLNELYAALHRRMAILMSLPFASLDRLSLQRRMDDIGRPQFGGAPAAAGRADPAPAGAR